jgi:hypothetical protein
MKICGAFLFLSIPLIGNEVINPTDGLFMTDWLLLMAKSIIEKNYLTHAGVKIVISGDGARVPSLFQ